MVLVQLLVGHLVAPGLRVGRGLIVAAVRIIASADIASVIREFQGA
jgi:hypothetical protein